MQPSQKLAELNLKDRYEALALNSHHMSNNSYENMIWPTSCKGQRLSNLETWITAPQTRSVGAGTIHWCFYQHLYAHDLTQIFHKLPCLETQCFPIIVNGTVPWHHYIERMEATHQNGISKRCTVQKIEYRSLRNSRLALLIPNRRFTVLSYCQCRRISPSWHVLIG